MIEMGRLRYNIASRSTRARGGRVGTRLSFANRSHPADAGGAAAAAAAAGVSSPGAAPRDGKEDRFLPSLLSFRTLRTVRAGIECAPLKALFPFRLPFAFPFPCFRPDPQFPRSGLGKPQVEGLGSVFVDSNRPTRRFSRVNWRPELRPGRWRVFFAHPLMPWEQQQLKRFARCAGGYKRE